MKIGRPMLAVSVLLALACSNPFGFLNEDKKMVLTGTVSNATTGEALAGVFVSLEWTPETNPGPGQGPVLHVDTHTAADGSYRVESKLSDVNCDTAFLRVATSGFKSVLIHPDCRSGKQTFDVPLPPS